MEKSDKLIKFRFSVWKYISWPNKFVTLKLITSLLVDIFIYWLAGLGYMSNFISNNSSLIERGFSVENKILSILTEPADIIGDSPSTVLGSIIWKAKLLTSPFQLSNVDISKFTSCEESVLGTISAEINWYLPMVIQRSFLI